MTRASRCASFGGRTWSGRAGTFRATVCSLRISRACAATEERSMMRNLLGLAVMTAVASCAGTRQPAETTPPPDDMTAAAALADSIRHSHTAADVAFMTGMIHHHGQALVMSRMAPSHGVSPSLQTMAARIINAQNDEIAL